MPSQPRFSRDIKLSAHNGNINDSQSTYKHGGIPQGLQPGQASLGRYKTSLNASNLDDTIEEENDPKESLIQKYYELII